MEKTVEGILEWRRHLPQYKLPVSDVKAIDYLVGEVIRYKKDPEKYCCPSGTPAMIKEDIFDDCDRER